MFDGVKFSSLGNFFRAQKVVLPALIKERNNIFCCSFVKNDHAKQKKKILKEKFFTGPIADGKGKTSREDANNFSSISKQQFFLHLKDLERRR